MEVSNCKKNSPKFKVRKMTKDDAQEALEVFASHDLHEGKDSVMTFLEVDPDGFYVAVNEEDGMIVHYV